MRSFTNIFEDADAIHIGNARHYYWASTNLSYTLAILPQHDFHVLLRQDGTAHGGSGHGNLRTLLNQLAKILKLQSFLPVSVRDQMNTAVNDHPLFNTIKSDGDVLSIIKDHLQKSGPYDEGVWSFIKGRIWADFDVVSFWDPWDQKMVQPTLKACQIVGVDPKQCIFEMDGVSCCDVSDPEARKGNQPKWLDASKEEELKMIERASPYILSYDEFTSNGVKQKDLTPEDKEARLRKYADSQMYKRIMHGGYNKMKREMDILKGAGLDPFTGKAKAGPSWQRRDGD